MVASESASAVTTLSPVENTLECWDDLELLEAQDTLLPDEFPWDFDQELLSLPPVVSMCAEEDEWRMDFSPSDPLEEIEMMEAEDFFNLDSFGEKKDRLPFEKRFEATRQSLQESMRRSQETRKSLSPGRKFKAVIDCVEDSGKKLQEGLLFQISSETCHKHAQQA